MSDQDLDNSGHNLNKNSIINNKIDTDYSKSDRPNFDNRYYKALINILIDNTGIGDIFTVYLNDNEVNIEVGEVLDDSFTAYISSFVSENIFNDVYISRPDGQERSDATYARKVPWEEVEGLEGGLDTVLLVVRQAGATYADNPALLQNFIATKLAPTIHRFQVTGIGTPENVTDMLLISIRSMTWPQDFPLGPIAGVRKLFEIGWGELRQQKNRDQGYYQTVAAIVSWYDSRIRKDDTENTWIIVSYLYALCSIETDRIQNNTGWFGRALNNLSANVANLRKVLENANRGGQDSAARVMNIISAYSVALKINSKKLADLTKDKETSFKIFNGFVWGSRPDKLLDSGDSVVAKIIAIVEMANVTSAWEKVDSVVFNDGSGTGEGIPSITAFIATRAGLLRMAVCQMDDWADASSAFFNAGVAARRAILGTERPAEMPEGLSRFRAAVNALGIMWAIGNALFVKGDGDSDVIAWSKLNGLDCAVNMFASLTEPYWTTWFKDQELTSLLPLINHIRWVLPKLSKAERIEEVRLNASWKEIGEIGIEGKSTGAEGDKREMLGVLQTIFNEAVDGKIQAPSIDREVAAQSEWMIACAERLDKLLCKVFAEKAPDGVPNAVELLERVLNSLIAWSQDLSSAHSTLFEKGAGGIIKKMLDDNNVPIPSLEFSNADSPDGWSAAPVTFGMKVYNLLQSGR